MVELYLKSVVPFLDFRGTAPCVPNLQIAFVVLKKLHIMAVRKLLHLFHFVLPLGLSFLNVSLRLSFHVAISVLLLFAVDVLLTSFESSPLSVNDSLNFPIIFIEPVMVFLWGEP